MVLGPLISGILSAFVPVAVEGAKQVMNRVTGGPQPTTVAEKIQLEQADVAKIEALAKLDNPYGQPSQWVVDLRASARYVAAGVVIVVGLGAVFSDAPMEVKALCFEAVSVAFGFLFGTRITANLKR